MSSSLGAGGARDPQAAIRMVYYPRTLNMAVRRNLAVAAGGFPTTSHGEDLEFSGRIMRQGFRAEFAPTARVLHNEKRTWLQVLREAFRKGRARVRLARQHGIHEFLHAVPALFCLYLIGLPPIGWAVCDWPLVWYSVWIPAACYLLVLLTLSVQSALSFRSFRVGLATPFYAVLLHIGYGTGYLTGCVKRLIP